MATKLYWTDPDSGEVVTVVFDAVTGLNPEDAVNITDHPIEEGFPATDGARSQPTLLTIEAQVSATPNAKIDTDVSLQTFSLRPAQRGLPDPEDIPLTIPPVPLQLSESGLLQAGIGALTGLLTGGPKARAWGPTATELVSVQAKALLQSTPRSRIRDTYDRLLRVKDQHALITILSSHRDYFDLMIARLGKSQTSADGSLAKFQIDLKQIRTVTSASVMAPKPAEPRGQNMANKGSQSAKPDADEARKKSLAKQFLASLPKLF